MSRSQASARVYAEFLECDGSLSCRLGDLLPETKHHTGNREIAGRERMDGHGHLQLPQPTGRDTRRATMMSGRAPGPCAMVVVLCDRYNGTTPDFLRNPTGTFG